MFTNILAPLDGSSFGERALTMARTIAAASGATLHIVHVHTPHDATYAEGLPLFDEDLQPLGREHERVYLERARDQIASQGINVVAANPDLVESIDGTLIAYTKANAIDLIVATTHGHSGWGSFWLGRVAEDLARASPVPILLIHPADEGNEALQFARVLVLLDGSPRAEAILDPAAALARILGLDITLLHAKSEGSMVFGRTASPSSDESSLREQALHTYLGSVAARLANTGIAVTSEIQAGPTPAEAIINRARQNRPILAMTTRGAGQDESQQFGRVANKVLRGIGTAALVYNPPK